MKQEDIISVLNQLPTRYPSDRTQKRAETAIEVTAELIAPVLQERGWRITKGGTSPSSSRSYTRIYLEPTDNYEHNPRNSGYNVVEVWEWETSNRYGFKPLTSKAICELCDELQAELLD